jgi:hypothetical protein
MSTGGQQSLGGAKFVIQADTSQFQSGLEKAEAQAQGSSHAIVDSLKTVQQQLAAINQTAMSTTNAISTLVQHLGQMRSATAGGMGGMMGMGGGNSSAMGLLSISYLIDDIQYGFRSIVNNIPQVGLAVGTAMGLSTAASMQFAGALGIVAVGINQAINHADQLAGAFKPVTDALHALSTWFEGSDVFKKMSDSVTRLSEDVEKLPAQLKKIRSAIEEVEKTPENERDLFQQEKLAGLKGAEKEAKQRLADEKLIEGMEDDQVKKNRAAAQKAFGQIAGGANAVRDYLIQEGMKPHEAAALVAGAGRGQGTDLDEILGRIVSDRAAEQFAPLFGATPEKQREHEAQEAQTKIHEKRQKEIEHETEKRKHLIDQLNRQGQEFEKEGKLEALHQQKEDIEKQFAREKHMLTAPQRQQLEDAIIGSKTPQEAKLLTSKAYADLALTSGANRIPEKQLDHLKRMDDNIKTIAKEIRNVGRLQ